MGKIKRLSKLGLRKYMLMLVGSFPVLTYLMRWLLGKRSDVDHDPRKVAREARMRRISENKKKHQQNIAHAGASPRQERKMEVEKTLAATRISAASMGKFDKRLDGEKKICGHGVKRKVRRNGRHLLLLKRNSLINTDRDITRNFIARNGYQLEAWYRNQKPCIYEDTRYCQLRVTFTTATGRTEASIPQNIYMRITVVFVRESSCYCPTAV